MLSVHLVYLRLERELGVVPAKVLHKQLCCGGKGLLCAWWLVVASGCVVITLPLGPCAAAADGSAAHASVIACWSCCCYRYNYDYYNNNGLTLSLKDRRSTRSMNDSFALE